MIKTLHYKTNSIFAHWFHEDQEEHRQNLKHRLNSLAQKEKCGRIHIYGTSGVFLEEWRL